MMAIEAACIAGHLGEWRYGTPAGAALQRGLQMAASRFAPFPDAPARQSQDELFRAAVDQALTIAGQPVSDDAATRHRAVIDAFNMLDGGVDLAAGLSHLVAVEPPSTMKDRRRPLARPIWQDGRGHSHTSSHGRI
jgi:hypothetical protein